MILISGALFVLLLRPAVLPIERTAARAFIAVLIAAYQLIVALFIALGVGIDVGWAELAGIGFFPVPVLISTGIAAAAAVVLAALTHLVTVRLRAADEPIRLAPSKVAASVVSSVLVFAGIFAALLAEWAKASFAGVGVAEMLYTLSQPLTGSDPDRIEDFLRGPLLTSVVWTLTALLAFWVLAIAVARIPRTRRAPRALRAAAPWAAMVTAGAVTLGAGVDSGARTIGADELRAYFFETTALFEEHYVDPASANVVFPEEKRNLVYIYLESMESTYWSTELGGAEPANLLPNLSALAEAGTNFSNSDDLGGAVQVPGVGFTVGGMIAQTAGVPLTVTGEYNENEYGQTSRFMPGAVSLGDLLEEAGYRQTLLIGSDGEFGGRSRYFTQHGGYEIRDYFYAIEHGWIPEDYHVWWGYEDARLFSFATETLTELAAGDEPFNFTMLTADTHFPSGLMTEETPELFPRQYSNVIHHSDAMVGDLVAWIQEQPWAEHTTVVIAGDHLSMDPEYFAELSEEYERTTVNVFLNSAVAPVSTKRRTFTTMDLFPSTLRALGAQFDGDRLGLGTDLFSGTPTLAEQLTVEEFSAELSRRSPYYQSEIMQGSDQVSQVAG
ncbi:LTA synthase family protein [Agromyces aerolatus]|uniref:LTA synthase family protein n=1 Tax=Agromyces sp. LY-1074 TaxID=3074080 RepID=UPI002862F68A|nr:MULTISPECIES: LTA synthase family protein [unclassified Agromyces]MDR5698328.1 LTA synthase family protein [Agromyces sp. LY-1074]MDR5704622.1 LTA synthase family protein [Agromyces sp. LY-1358]